MALKVDVREVIVRGELSGGSPDLTNIFRKKSFSFPPFEAYVDREKDQDRRHIFMVESVLSE